MPVKSSKNMSRTRLISLAVSVPPRKLPLSSPYLDLKFKDLLLHCAPCRMVKNLPSFAPAARQLRLHTYSSWPYPSSMVDSPHFAAQDSDKPRSAVTAASSSCDDYDRASPPPMMVRSTGPVVLERGIQNDT
ncbi:hypothetical protein GGX14DRAFT_567450 [Mycena pura]|uniref:Uncharacterized protein n=1 Tax=Mycena pura TaxID=153505 RepID=A0AAD6VAF4_9AGAR|nr:hypothetical protein GGX14DRAFT_567450 [Mycena pura]